MTTNQQPIRVLVVDDSPLIQKILTRGLSKDPALEIVGVAGDAYQARDLIVQLKPDVMTLDIEMPRMNGLEFLRRLIPNYPMPVIMVSTLSQEGAQITFDCLAAGAMDFVCKPSGGQSGNTESMLMDLRAKIRAVVRGHLVAPAAANHAAPTTTTAPPAVKILGATHKLIALGASTGGTEATRRVLRTLPPQIPGMLIVQHMPPGFTKAYADRLNDECAIEVREAVHGDVLYPGLALLAPGGLHMSVRREGGEYHVACWAGDKVNWHCPSVDVMMESVATHARKMATGIILTGMGNDGAQGLLAMRRAGARTLAQDEDTSVVFGMPRVAYECGGAEKLYAIDRIAPALLEILSSAQS
ncbi:MAG: chemotaxis response regulator protein-glutamate methylesterase [Desulfobulbaceae bacterium]|nr:chemotaxis response regulator protein-glutamate methylesterase [Desulfobulbaceae bacterium]